MTTDLFEKMRQEVDEKDMEDNYRIRLCLEIALHYSGGFLDNAEGIVHFYHKSLEVIGPDIQSYLVDGEGYFKRMKKNTLEMLPFWASDEALDRVVYGLDLVSGTPKNYVSDKAFVTYNIGRHYGWVRLLLPLEFIAQDTEAFVALACTAAEKLRFSSGSGGYAVHLHRHHNSQLESGRVYALSRRYLGIDFGSPRSFSRFLEHSLKCVNWLTFVGDGLLARLGGREALAAQFSPAIVVHPLPHGVLIQAGPAPGFGDVNRRETLPHYHEVGRVLKPLRIPEEALGRWNSVGGSENTRRWLARFDD